LGKNLRPGVFGDELAIVYCASKVNLGLLSSAAGDPAISDQTSARTFQIPASGGFMLHEDTPEVRSYFQPEKEIMVFSGEADLLLKLDTILRDDALRKTITADGHRRCMKKPYDYSSAAKTILNVFENSAA
jgi:spore maturation protein CgeB